ncbi:MAG: biopolymer transporter ExbD [Candidatus Methylomirabilia bacterium]
MAFKPDQPEGGASRRIGASLAEINVIPFVDVVLVLLLIFMITAPMMYRGIDVNLPKTSSRPTAIEERMVLTLTKDRIVYLNGKPVPIAGLDRKLRAIFKNRTDKTLYLRADRSLAYGFVVTTMDRARRAGVEKVGMVTAPALRRR